MSNAALRACEAEEVQVQAQDAEIPRGDWPLITKGIRANRHRQYSLVLTGVQVYDLLRLIETVAVQNPDYLTVRQCVLHSENIRTQARRQGF